MIATMMIIIVCLIGRLLKKSTDLVRRGSLCLAISTYGATVTRKIVRKAENYGRLINWDIKAYPTRNTSAVLPISY